MTVAPLTPADWEQWDRRVADHPLGAILQTSRWGQHKATFGWDWEIVTPDETCGALILYKSLPLKLGTIAYIPRGPVVDWDNRDQTMALFAVVRWAARRKRAWALWVEPPLWDTEENRQVLRALNLKPTLHTIQPPRTILVNIAGEEEAVLARMKSKTRYNIRLAERKGVTVRLGGLEDVAAFYALMVETGARDGFGVHSAEYFHRALELFLPADQAALLLAEVDGELVAGLMAFALGQTAWYFYGASSNHHREKMPTYAVQWAAVRWAKAHGCTCYDLWGIPDADEAELEAQFAAREDGLWGVYRFKRGFGGQVTRYVGLWEQSLNPLYPLAIHLRPGL